jgi:long-chain fatty acid transport protein
MKKRILIIAALAMILIAPAIMASGFGYYQHGTKATGMGGAFVAMADDASAVYYNPAGIAFQKGTSIMAGFHPVKPNSTATFANISTDTTTPWKPPAAGYITGGLTDSIRYGFGVFVPYGLEVRWPETWIGNQISYRSYLTSYYFRPVIAIKLNDNFAIGGGVDFVYSKVELGRMNRVTVNPLLPTASIDASIAGDGSGVGFNLSALWKVNEQFSLGVKYQHEVEIDYEGTVDFTATPTASALVNGIINNIFTDQDVKTSITMPAEFVAGLSFKASEDLTLNADVQWTKWSVYDQLDIAFTNPTLNFGDVNSWDDSWMFRFGGEYWVSHDFALRGGYIRDTNPAPDNTVKPLLPDSDRNEFTLGLGYDTKESCCWGRLNLDFAMQYVLFEERTSTYPLFPATYESDALILGFGIGVTF